MWVHEPHMAIYVRRSQRILTSDQPALTPCLDIASVEVDDGHRGRGLFTDFLTRFERSAKKLKCAVYVESIQNIRLEKFLGERGYKWTHNSSDVAPNMYKFP